jgi:very-short-patch-repair endonuclease
MSTKVRKPRATSDGLQTAHEFRKQPTDSERLLWSAVRDRRLDGLKFRRQQPVGDYVLDFYGSELELAIEVDGLPHDLTWEKDSRRQGRLEAFGIRVIRVSAEDVERNREAVVDYMRSQIRELARAEGSNLPSPAHGSGMSGEAGRGEGAP